MQSRWFWILATVLLVPFFLTSSPVWAEPRIKVQPIDTAGIEKIVKQSEGAAIVVLAAWCFPCRQELPTLIKLYDKYKSRGLKMVGISVDLGGPSMIQPLLDKAFVNFPVYWADEKVVRDLNIRGIPLLFLVKNGEIIQEVMGRQSEASLEKKISLLIKEPVPPKPDEDQEKEDIAEPSSVKKEDA
jgi:thioredoxin-like negative regulator of GroEL